MKTEITVIGIVTDNMGKTLDFYRLLGLEIPAGAESDAHVEVEFASGLKLAFDTVEVVQSYRPDYQPTHEESRVALAFPFSAPAEVDSAATAFEDAGYLLKVRPFDAFWGQRYATAIDPNGVCIDLFAPLP